MLCVTSNPHLILLRLKNNVFDKKEFKEINVVSTRLLLKGLKLNVPVLISFLLICNAELVLERDNIFLMPVDDDFMMALGFKLIL